MSTRQRYGLGVSLSISQVATTPRCCGANRAILYRKCAQMGDAMVLDVSSHSICGECFASSLPEEGLNAPTVGYPPCTKAAYSAWQAGKAA